MRVLPVLSIAVIAAGALLALAAVIYLSISVSGGQNTAIAAPASGAVTLDTSSLSRTSATFSHTVPAGSDRPLAVAVMIEGAEPVGSVTYGGNILTQAVVTASGANSGAAVEIKATPTHSPHQRGPASSER